MHTWSPADAIWAAVGVKNGSRLCTALIAWAISPLVGCLLGAAVELAGTVAATVVEVPAVVDEVLGAEPVAGGWVTVVAGTLVGALVVAVVPCPVEAAAPTAVVDDGDGAETADVGVGADGPGAGAVVATGLGLAMAPACRRVAMSRARWRFPPWKTLTLAKSPRRNSTATAAPSPLTIVLC